MATLHDFMSGTVKKESKQEQAKHSPTLSQSTEVHQKISKTNFQPWIHKYLPKKGSDIIGQDDAVTAIKTFIETYKQRKQKPLLLFGPTGTGKTSAVHAIANDLDREIIEINASDFRNKDLIEKTIGNSLGQSSLFFKEKVILVDEIDGMSGTKDRGGLQAMMTLLEQSPYPIIMSMNDPWDNKYSSLRNKCQMVEFKELDYIGIYSILTKIVKNEHIVADDNALKLLSRQSGGDARAAINDLQMLASAGTLGEEDLKQLADRNRTESIVQAITKVLKTTDPNIAKDAFEHIDEDTNEVMLWLDANIPKEYTKPEDLAAAYDKLSRADIHMSRIRRWQHWRFMIYANALLSAGVAVSKKEKYKEFNKYTQTGRLLKIWWANQRYAKRKAIAQKIAAHMHCSTQRALQSTLPYLQHIIQNNKQFSISIAKELDLTDDELAWLKEKSYK